MTENIEIWINYLLSLPPSFINLSFIWSRSLHWKKIEWKQRKRQIKKANINQISVFWAGIKQSFLQSFRLQSKFNLFCIQSIRKLKWMQELINLAGMRRKFDSRFSWIARIEFSFLKLHSFAFIVHSVSFSLICCSLSLSCLYKPNLADAEAKFNSNHSTHSGGN